MAGLQRSAVSFRRQGSSGIVWDDKFLSGELNQVANQNQEHQQQRELQEKLDINQERDVKPSSSGSITTIERSRSNGGQRAYRTGKVSPAIEPPSPRVSACGFCSAFGKPTKNHRKRAAFGVGFYCRRRFVSKNLVMGIQQIWISPS
ncbi:MAPK kinase substrate protein At1g80180-like isoform X2 [Manihot esculenta]|uniref:MAPK kinase substrate protein At1g80180-like isoform X2 n=1 Tax=Manihot esculenta TaxID=3983 RepID=UPI000B5D824B|nr:MAPK kinase substrate protein At1g80180-like isoform X2 [Manihot esculenta]